MSESPTRTLYVEFDGAQLTVTTNDPGVHESLYQNFEHMLVQRVSRRAGDLTILRRDDGYDVQSASTLRLPAAPLHSLMPPLHDEVRLQFMRSRPDLLWLHGAAVERDGTALILAGSSGQGKSTLSTLLCERGWRLLSDDVAPVRMDVDQVLPFIQRPVRRLPPESAVRKEDIWQLEREVVNLPPERLRREPANIRAVVFLSFVRGKPAILTRLPPGGVAFEMLRNATNFVDHKAEAVRRASNMALALPGYALSYGSSKEAVVSLCEIT